MFERQQKQNSHLHHAHALLPQLVHQACNIQGVLHLTLLGPTAAVT
jgi:hypothetical protein